MTRTARRVLVAVAVALVLAAVNRSIAAKERIRREGTAVFLELAPVDPRALMQGAYMALRFALADDIERRAYVAERVASLSGADGFGRHAAMSGEGGFAVAPIRLDARGVATLADERDADALRIRYRVRGGRPWLGTNAFFFSEGEALRFAPARFGEFRLDRETGEAVLVGLRDADLRKL